MWRPLPDEQRYTWLTVATEDRLVMLPAGHHLANADTIAFEDLLDEPFLALPRTSGPARDYWLATESRGGRKPVIGAEIASTDETREALWASLGVCLVAGGNAALFQDDRIAIRPVTGVPPSELVLAWRADDRRPLVSALVESTRASVARMSSRTGDENGAPDPASG